VVRGTLLGAALAVAFIGATPGLASALPGDHADGTTVANVGVEAGITLTGLTPSFLLTGTPGQTVTADGAVTFNVETNNVAGYGVTVQSATPTMVPADAVTNTDVIQISDLTVRETATSTFTPVSDVAVVTVHSQAERSANGGDDLSNDYEMNIPVVNADTYAATLDYVATTL
jgi:hypothetical protein